MKRLIKKIWNNYFFRIAFYTFVISLLWVVGCVVASHFLNTKTLKAQEEIFALKDPLLNKRYQRMLADYRNTEKERALLKQVPIFKADLIFLTQYLDGAAASSGITQTIETIKPENADKKITYEVPVIRYRLKVSGSQVSVINYVRRINGLPYLVKVESVDLQSIEAKDLASEAVGIINIAVLTADK